MEYYAEQSLFIKIIIFVITWFIIAAVGTMWASLTKKVVSPEVPLPQWLKVVLYGWFNGEQFNLPCIFLQFGNYVLFFVYALGDIFHYSSHLPDSLPHWIWIVSGGAFILCLLTYCFIFFIREIVSFMSGQRHMKKINRYGRLKRKRNKRSIYRDKY